MPSPFVEQAVGALQATISVLLVLLYGAVTVKWLGIINSDTVDKMTKLGTNILLPCLLFTEMGKESSADKLRQYWILPVFTLSFTFLSILYAFLGVRLLKIAPQWMYPAAAFPNMLSLPLLMLESLARTGAIDKLLNGKSDTVGAALSRGKVYFLVNGLAGNIIRFAVGPYLLTPDTGDKKPAPATRDAERQPLLGGIQPGEPIPNLHARHTNEDETNAEKTRRLLGKVRDFFNPPLVAGLLAVFFGLIPGTRHLLFEEEGALNASFTQSIKKLGQLYTAMQMFILGGKIVSKNAGRAKMLPLAYLVLWRFFLVPLASIGVVYSLRSRFPNYIKHDPMLDFVLAISHTGPPAITLAAMADMSGLDEKDQGTIATVLLASYIVTPLLSLSVSTIMLFISKLY